MVTINQVQHSIYLDEDEECGQQCGEVFLTTKGSIVFHCTLCESKYKGYDEYAAHITANHTTTSDPWVINEASDGSDELEDENDGASDIGSDELEVIEGINEEKAFQREALEEYEIPIKDLEKEAKTQIGHDSCERKPDDTATKTKIFTEPQTNNHMHRNGNFVSRKRPKIEPDYKCSKCDKSFSDYMELKNHMTIHRLRFHSEEFKEKTEHCHRSRDKKKSDKLVTPIPEHHKTKSSTVDIEQKDTANLSLQVGRPLQKRELSTNISPERRKYKCPICGYAATDKSNLKVHIRRHTEENQVPCPVCSKKFFMKSEVKIHMRSHTHEKRFLCTVCGGKYANNTQLVYHMKRHKNQRDYKCTQCEKSFFLNAQLKNHIASHLSDRQFACNICPAKFVQREAMKNHLKLHANKREYKCELCDAGFNQKAGLYSHMKATHKII